MKKLSFLDIVDIFLNNKDLLFVHIRTFILIYKYIRMDKYGMKKNQFFLFNSKIIRHNYTYVCMCINFVYIRIDNNIHNEQ